MPRADAKDLAEIFGFAPDDTSESALFENALGGKIHPEI